ncbi:MAG: DoxX family membrane protein [Armatimonadota bacterium]|nr:DoxX family membrane protein [Armatimonadota bacterium]
METLFIIGRILLGGFYLFNALNHFTKADMMAGYAGSKGVPAPKAMVLVTGVLLLIGGLSILFGVYPTVGVLALVVFFVPVTFWMHNFWAVQDPMQKTMEMVQFAKNMALLGAALALLAIPQPWPLSLGR